MPHYLSLDAGGSKCAAFIYDDTFRILAAAQTGGVNHAQNSPEIARKNLSDCLSSLVQQFGSNRVDVARISYVGPREDCDRIFSSLMDVGEMVFFSEHRAGILASALQMHGILALSGTGCDVFHITGDEIVREPSFPLAARSVIGGWGPVVGDMGSGTWIGHEALRAVSSAFDGWGEETIMVDLLKEQLDQPLFGRALLMEYARPENPFSRVAKLTRTVQAACRMGDKVALGIVKQAGEIMARQTFALIDKFGARGDITCCGGAWKTHPSMFKAFKEYLLRRDPNLVIRKPAFEMIMAGPVYLALQKMPREEAEILLSEKMPDYILRW